MLRKVGDAVEDTVLWIGMSLGLSVSSKEPDLYAEEKRTFI